MKSHALPLQIFYDPRQAAASNLSFSPSAQKPAQVVQSWRRLPIPQEYLGFSPATREQLYQVHERRYVDGVLNRKLPNGFRNRSAEVAASLPWVCGSAMAAALGAFQTKRPTFSPTSGAHHAHWDSGGGFCTFNSLVLAAVEAKKAGATRVGIVDLDCHFGDGTEDIVEKLGLSFLHQYSFGGEELAAGASAARWLAAFDAKLRQFTGFDLILFNAGADPHVDDPLGGILTSDQMRVRDHTVYEFCKEINVPVATMLAGGYQKDAQGSIRPVLDLHDQTLTACWEVYARAK